MTRAIAVGLISLAGAAPLKGIAAQPQDRAAPSATPARGYSWDEVSRRFGGSMADTKPSRVSTMRFSASTEVMTVNVTLGQRVSKGDVLIRARDAELIAAMELQKIQAENENEIRSAEQALIKAQSLYDNGIKSGNLSASERVGLEVDLEQAKLQLAQTRVNLQQQKIRMKQLEGQYERFRLEAPFDGVVDDLKVDVGQGVNEQMDVLRVVDTRTLWLEPAPSIGDTLRLSLKEGSPAWVLIDLPGLERPALVEGRVLFVTPFADSASLTRRVRVEVPNQAGWPAGTIARVRFEDPGAEWDAYRAPATASAANP